MMLRFLSPYYAAAIFRRHAMRSAAFITLITLSLMIAAADTVLPF